MVSLRWEQVNAWRLGHHWLDKRAERGQMLEVVSQIGGLHAQVMSAAELQVWARVKEVSSHDVQKAPWQERTLVKTWAMPGTLHLLASTDFPLMVAALSTLRHFRRASWQKYHGVTLEELEALIDGVRATLSEVGMTREQLAEVVASHTKLPKLLELLRSGWGALLKPAAFQGHLCFGPNQGQNVTFVQPKAWLGTWTPIESQAALKEVTRRYLRTYGPATIDEVDRWFGLEPSDVKKIVRALGDEIEEVDVEGWKAWMLASSRGQMVALESTQTVRLLPHFDPYTIAVARHSQYLLSEPFKGRVYRPQGWISPVVLVNGRIEGVWESEQKRSQTNIKVEMFASPSVEVRQGVASEVERLVHFWEIEVQHEIHVRP